MTNNTQCKCELDGFLGAVTSRNCSEHNTQHTQEPSQTRPEHGGWEKEFDKKFSYPANTRLGIPGTTQTKSAKGVPNSQFTLKRIKSFISRIEADAYQRGREAKSSSFREGYEEVSGLGNTKEHEENYQNFESFIRNILAKQAEEISEAVEKKIQETKKHWHDKAPRNCALCWEEDYCEHKIKRDALSDTLLAIKQVINK